MPLEELFFEMGAVIVVAAVVAMVVFRLRQPLIIAYIIAGVVVGPGVLGLAHSAELYEALSKLGVAFMLFTVGLGLNWRSVKDVGGVALATGFGQVIVMGVLGFVVSRLLGFDAMTGVYLAAAFAFSSTIIIVKLLMDKEDIDTLYGRVSTGFLLVQDFLAMLLLLVLSAVAGGGTVADAAWQTAVKAAVAVPLLLLVSAYVVPSLVRYAARSQELLLVFAVAWCFLVSGALYTVGFGVELGALIAGIMLSGSLYQQEINARIRPLRDFFLILFFILLGTHLDPAHLVSLWAPIVAFTLLVLLAKPLAFSLIMRLLGYHPRTAFLSGTAAAQISEFSFIILAAGLSLGHVSDDALVIATAVGLLTIAASAYLIEHNEAAYHRLHPFLARFAPKREDPRDPKRPAPDVILFGFEPVGSRLLDSVRKLGKRYLIVDFDPQVVRELAERGEPIVYGDAGDDNFLSEISAEKARFIVSTIPDLAVSTELLTYLRSHRFNGSAVVSVHSEQEAEKCYAAGATFVIVPNVLSGERIRELLEQKRVRKASWKALAAARGKV